MVCYVFHRGADNLFYETGFLYL